MRKTILDSRRKTEFCVFIVTVLVFYYIPNQVLGNPLHPKSSKIRISSFQVPDYAVAGEPFIVNLTIEKNKLFPLHFFIQIDLLDEFTGIPKTTIGTKYVQFGFKIKDHLSIKCTIRVGDVSYLTGVYNLQASLFGDYPHLKWTKKTPITSTTKGLHLTPPLDQVHILNVDVTQNLIESQKSFLVNVSVETPVSLSDSTWVEIDLVEKPPLIPQIEGVINIPGLGSQKTELGNSRASPLYTSGNSQIYQINCYLRKSEMSLSTFNIQAVVYVTIEGNDYQADASAYYGIVHEQPLIKDWKGWSVLAVIAFFGVLIAIALIAFTTRILYPMYKIKKVELDKEKERIFKIRH